MIDKQESKREFHRPGATAPPAGDLHPCWQALIKLCAQLGHGEIERLKIQDGLPVFAERVIEKHKLA